MHAAPMAMPTIVVTHQVQPIPAAAPAPMPVPYNPVRTQYLELCRQSAIAKAQQLTAHRQQTLYTQQLQYQSQTALQYQSQIALAGLGSWAAAPTTNPRGNPGQWRMSAGNKAVWDCASCGAYGNADPVKCNTCGAPAPTSPGSYGGGGGYASAYGGSAAAAFGGGGAGDRFKDSMRTPGAWRAGKNGKTVWDCHCGAYGNGDPRQCNTCRSPAPPRF